MVWVRNQEPGFRSVYSFSHCNYLELLAVSYSGLPGSAGKRLGVLANW